MLQVRGVMGLVNRLSALAALLLVGLVIAGPVWAEDAAKELKSKMQRAKGRMMSMEIDQAVALFAEATAMLDKLKSENPGHEDLAKLQKDYDKLAQDLAKKVTQQAQRAFNPMQSQLEKVLREEDNDKIRQARDGLAEAIAKHKENLGIAGGDAGAALLTDAQALLDEADAKLGTPPSGKPAAAMKPEGPKPAVKKPASRAPAAAAGGDAKQINSEIQRKLRGARHLDTPGTVALAEEIRQLIEQLRAAEPNHNKLAEYEQKVDKMVADAYAADVSEARSEIQRHIDRIEMYLERNEESERPQLTERRELLGKALDDHRAALEAAGAEGQKLIAETEAVIKRVDDQIGKAMAGDALVNEWIAELDVYRANGEKDLTPGINSAAEYEHIKGLRAEADQVWTEYQRVDFAQGKTKELERSESFFRQSMEEADRNLEYAVSSRLEDAEARITRIADWFAADQEWKADKSKRPKPFSDEVLEEARRAVDEIAGFVQDHPEVGRLRDQLNSLFEEAAARRKAGIALTFLRADKYQGPDADDLKTFARKLVPKTHEGAEVLRLTIFTPDWKEETVVEWTDTTRSALRKRTTRTLMFMVAFRDTEGVFRDIGYLNQDRTSDGGWGPTYGHLAKYRNPMLQENVEKDEPEAD